MRILLFIGITALFITVSCSEKSSKKVEHDSSEATVASETGSDIPLPADVLFLTKSLIAGQLYSSPDFDSPVVAAFDTNQHIYVLDTTNTIFIRARIRKDTSLLTGFVPRTILPEKKED